MNTDDKLALNAFLFFFPSFLRSVFFCLLQIYSITKSILYLALVYILEKASLTTEWLYTYAMSYLLFISFLFQGVLVYMSNKPYLSNDHFKCPLFVSFSFLLWRSSPFFFFFLRVDCSLLFEKFISACVSVVRVKKIQRERETIV